MEPGLIYDDKREIEYIVGHGEAGVYYRVGYQDVTKIEAYMEQGIGNAYPWFAVYKGDKLAIRVSSVYVEQVVYA